MRKMTICFVLLPLFIAVGYTAAAQEKHESWFPFEIADISSQGGLVDLSFLNEKIAGQNGFVSIADGHFVTGDGRPIRFLGENLTFQYVFPTHDTAALIARSLAQKGMNAVRMHHMDMRSAPSGLWNASMTDFDSLQLDRLDYLIYQLKLNGIYTNINLHVSYTYPGAEYDDVSGFRFGKSLDHFYPPFIHQQKEYARKLLTHYNPYTKTIYHQEPAIAFVEINNENSLLSNWSSLPELKDEHKKALERLWATTEFSRKTSGKHYTWIIENYETASELQKEMLWSFLVDVEMSYAKQMTNFLKDSLGVKALITGSQASYSGIAGVAREATFSDFLDMHSYWQHPSFPSKSWSSTDWFVKNSSMVSDKGGGTLPRFSEHRVSGKPLTISEYDHPAPGYYAAEMYPMLTSLAAFQDLDGIYHFTFDGKYNRGRIQGFFASAGHPMKQLYITVGAAIFRMREVKPGNEVVQLKIPPAGVIKQLAKYGTALRLHNFTLNKSWQEAGAPLELFLTHRMSIDLTADSFGLSKANARSSKPLVTDTKQITWDTRDSAKATFVVNTPSAKVTVGYLGGNLITLGDVTIQMDTTTNDWACITLTSLDGKPLTESKKILIVAGGRAENTNMGWNDEKTTVSNKWGERPVRVEGIKANITFKSGKHMKILALDGEGESLGAITLTQSGGITKFMISPKYKTLWYLLTVE